MQWHAFVVQLLDAIAWPLVLVFVIVLFRSPITTLIPMLRSARFKQLDLQFGDLESKAEKADLPAVPEPEVRPALVHESSDDWKFGDYIDRLALISPRAAISEAWRHVELALRDAASRRDKRVPRNLVALSRELESAGILAPDAASLVRDLRPLRNQAVHADEFALRPEQALEFAAIAERIVESITIPPEAAAE